MLSKLELSRLELGIVCDEAATFGYPRARVLNSGSKTFGYPRQAPY
jgi:hypothetical protein